MGAAGTRGRPRALHVLGQGPETQAHCCLLRALLEARSFRGSKAQGFSSLKPHSGPRGSRRRQPGYSPGPCRACSTLCPVSASGRRGAGLPSLLPGPSPVTPEALWPQEDGPPSLAVTALCLSIPKDKKYASDKYKDIYTELSIVRAKADCDVSRLQEQLKAATDALGERSPEHTPVSGYGESSSSGF